MDCHFVHTDQKNDTTIDICLWVSHNRGIPMHRRHEYLNVPIEVVRTVVAISETGSLSKAGERLGLSQPAVSGQMKRIQNLLGGGSSGKRHTGPRRHHSANWSSIKHGECWTPTIRCCDL